MSAFASEPAGDDITKVVRTHYYQLDSLRGIAALAVAIHHWHIVWALCPHSKYAEALIQVLPFRLLVAGHASVMMFFVLSGFVLSLPQVRGKSTEYLPYLVKRICRIYLPYCVALAIAILGCWKWHGRRSYGAWVDSSWQNGPQWHSILQHLLFLGAYPNIYNSSFWTLVQEMRISIIFPFLCLFAVRLKRQDMIALALGLLFAGGVVYWVNLIPSTFSGTISYMGMFVIGIFLARWLPQLRTILSGLKWKLYWTLFLVSTFIYAYAPSFFYALRWSNPAWDGFTAFGAAGVIVFSLIDRNIEAVLLHRFIMHLGKISYSTYLVHMPILLAFCYIFYGRLSPTVWLVPYLVATLALATVMFYTVEAPSIKLGKVLAGKIAQRKRVRAWLQEAI